MAAESDQLELFVPDRFDAIQSRPESDLRKIVVRVDYAIERINTIKVDIHAAGRGGFLIMYGSSGSGKSTFLNTLNLFFKNTEILSIKASQPIEETLNSLPATTADLRVVIIEGRDALKDTATEILEAAIHAINSFIRTPQGKSTLVAWPVNAAKIEKALIDIAKQVGDDSLLGVDEPSFRFNGPPKERYREIAAQTIETLNQGATLADLGVSDAQLPTLLNQSKTIGQFLAHLRKQLIKNEAHVRSLIKTEQCKLWVVVVAGNDVEGDVGSLTRGTTSSIDVSRLIEATGANLVKDLKKSPEKLGILGTALDSKILFIPVIAAISIVRTFADPRLQKQMSDLGIKLSGKGDGLERIRDSSVGRVFASSSMGLKARGSKAGEKATRVFKDLTRIASKNDVALNKTIAEALKAAGFIKSYATEKNLGTGLKRRTDIVCESNIGTVRLEIMWRAKTGRAEIANYSLTKLNHYGRAIGLLD